jgi:hypothetical protein
MNAGTSGLHDETHGPVQRALAGKLAAAGFTGVEVGLAERSPFAGPALRVRVGAVGDPAAVARWLAAQAEVGAVAVRPPQVYVDLTTAALRRWAVAPVDDGAVSFGSSSASLVHGVPPADDAGLRGPTAETGSLDAFRVRAVAAARARLDEAHGATAAVVERPGGGPCAEVGAVEVPHGPLRARHGGSVVVEDLLADLPGDGPAEAGALLRVVMLRTRAGRRLRLDDARLAVGAADGLALWAALAADDADPDNGGPAPDPVARTLIIELERVPGARIQAGRRADPALLVGAARSLTAALARVPTGDPLRAVATAALGELARLAGIARPVPATVS